jgi:transcriptional regulator with XRE-family HTH domain
MFWSNVKQLLAAKKILQKDFAEDIGYNVATLKNQMTRNISPDVDTAVKIAQYLNTTVEYLATGIQPELSKQDVLNYLQNHLS